MQDEKQSEFNIVPSIAAGLSIIVAFAIVFAAITWIQSVTGDVSSSSNVSAPSSSFTSEQNDQEGYNNTAWDTPVLEFDKELKDSPEQGRYFIKYTDPKNTNRFIAKIIGVPEERRSSLFSYSDTKWSVVPSNFYSETKDDVEYVFYKGRFAMAFSELKASNYDAVLSDLSARFPQIDSFGDSWDDNQITYDEGEERQRQEINVTQFKRGSSNTRVYLIQGIYHVTGAGYNIKSAYLLYVPNTVYQEIRETIVQNENLAERDTKAKDRERQEPDLTKVQ